MAYTENVFWVFAVGFFAVYFTLVSLQLSTRALNAVIAIGSLLRYSVSYPPATLLLLLHSTMARVGGPRLLPDADKRLRRGVLLAVLVGVSLAILALFKYMEFFHVLLHQAPSALQLIFPLGISFYTFTAIGYYVDCFRGKVIPTRSFVEALVLISFWPHLAAGPILRADNIFRNLRTREPLTQASALLAGVLICSGLVKKLLIADNLGAYVDWNFDYGVSGMSCVEAWVTLFGYGGADLR